MSSISQPWGQCGQWQDIRSLEFEILHRHLVCFFLKPLCRLIGTKEDENFVLGTMSWLSIFRGKRDFYISSIDITFQAVAHSCRNPSVMGNDWLWSYPFLS